MGRQLPRGGPHGILAGVEGREAGDVSRQRDLSLELSSEVGQKARPADCVLVPLISLRFKTSGPGFPGGAVVENPPANAGHTGSSPGLERSHMPRSN